MNTDKIQESLREFAVARDWEQFHTPKNLATALSVEVSELLEIFQWCRDGNDIKYDDYARIGREVADIFIYLLRFCDVINLKSLDLLIENKIKDNADKYPVPLAKGNAIKYNRRA